MMGLSTGKRPTPSRRRAYYEVKPNAFEIYNKLSYPVKDPRVRIKGSAAVTTCLV